MCEDKYLLINPRMRSGAGVALTVSEENNTGLDARRCFAWVLGVLVVFSTLWSLATPLGASPDENEHIVRAATVVRGQIVDPNAPGRAPLDVVARVPADYGAALAAPLCYAFDQRIPAGCEGRFPASTRPVSAAIYVGRYPPVYYALVGWPTLLFRAPVGFYLVRLVSALLIDALIAFAVTVALVRVRSPLPLAAVLLAVTPEALYLSAVVNPSSLEVAAALAFWSGLVVMATRYRSDPPRPLLAGIAVAGVLLTVARPISPVWTLTALIVVSPAWWSKPALRRLAARWDVRAVAAALVAAAAGTTGWTLAEHALRTLDGPLPARGTSTLTLLHDAVGQATGYVQQAVGVFGLAVPVPQLVVIVWVALVGLLAVTAWARLEGREERRMLVAMGVAALVLPTAIVTAGARTHGFIGFGRYFLPLYMGLPLLAGAILGGRRSPEDRRMARVVVWGAGAGQVVAFVWCLHRYLVGSGGPLSPLQKVPGGWSPPLPGAALDLLFVVATAATGAALVAAVDHLAGHREPIRLGARLKAVARQALPDRDRKWTELDGVRALMLFVVALYHLFSPFTPSWNPLRPSGGYLSVDMFFLVSGFLITSLLVTEREERGRISLKAFYGRRALRLFPALAVLLVVVGGLAELMRHNPWSHPTLLALPWVLFYVGNWNGAFYASIHPLGALGHTWSLSVEEQFYLIWPVVLILLCRRLRNYRTIAALLVGAAVVEDVYRYLVLRHGWPIRRVYYGTDTHSDAFIVGCAVALWLVSRHRAPLGRRAARLLAGATVAAIAALWLLMMRFSFFVSPAGLWFAIPAACVCGAIILANLVTRPVPVIGHFLRMRPLVWVGKRSYGIYLWLTAIEIMLNGRGMAQLGLYPYNAMIIAVSIAAGAASYRYVELPFLRRKKRLQRVTQDEPAGQAPAGPTPRVLDPV